MEQQKSINERSPSRINLIRLCITIQSQEQEEEEEEQNADTHMFSEMLTCAI